MSTKKLIQSFIEEDESSFKNIIDDILETKIDKKKQNIVFEITKKVFEHDKNLNNFDNLNETNQVRLINRLVESRANFHNTIEFCTKFKERYNQ